MRITDLALTQVGTTEQPLGSNNVKYNTAYYGRPVSGPDFPWCATFLWWLMREIGEPWAFAQKSVYCPFIMNDAKKKGMWTSDLKEIQEGDFVIFGNRGAATHIGLCIINDGTAITTVEGNTQDRVLRKTYPIKTTLTILGACKIKYQDSNSENPPMMTELTENALKAINYLVDKKRINSPDLWIQRIKKGDDALCWLFIKWAEDNGFTLQL